MAVTASTTTTFADSGHGQQPRTSIAGGHQNPGCSVLTDSGRKQQPQASVAGSGQRPRLWTAPAYGDHKQRLWTESRAAAKDSGCGGLHKQRPRTTAANRRRVWWLKVPTVDSFRVWQPQTTAAVRVVGGGQGVQLWRSPQAVAAGNSCRRASRVVTRDPTADVFCVWRVQTTAATGRLR